MSYLPPVVSMRAHVLSTSSCFLEGSCLIYPPVVSRRTHVLFTSSCF
jgi:hypothetical protein